MLSTTSWRLLYSVKTTSIKVTRRHNLKTANRKWITTQVFRWSYLISRWIIMYDGGKKRKISILLCHYYFLFDSLFLILKNKKQLWWFGRSVAKTRWRLAGLIWKGIRKPVTTKETRKNGTWLRLCRVRPLLVPEITKTCLFLITPYFFLIFCF